MKTGSACDGWGAIKVKGATARYLVANDPPAAKGVLAHNEHGEQTCGWEAAR